MESPVASTTIAIDPAVAIATHGPKYPPQAKSLHRRLKSGRAGVRRGLNFENVRAPLLALFIAIPALGACGSPTGSGAPVPAPITSAATATSPSQTPPTIPENLPPGAATAIFEYFRLLNLALETGRTAELEDLVASDCPCLNPVPAIHAIFRDGLLIGAKYQIERISVVSTSDSQTTIQVDSVRSAATQVTNSSGVKTILPEHRNITDFILENYGDLWLIVSSKVPQ